MRTIKFFFKVRGDLEANRRLVTELMERFSPPSSVEVTLSPMVGSDGSLAGIELSGEHELVSITSEKVRKYLRRASVRYREEEQPYFPDEKENQFLASLVSEPEATEPEAQEESEDESETDEGSDSPTYGEYPRLPGMTRQVGPRRRPSQADPQTRAALEKLAMEGEFGFRRKGDTLNTEERKALAFYRATKSGVAFYRLGLHEDAERKLLEAVRLQRTNAEVHYYLGLVYDQLGRLDLSERHFKSAIKNDPEVGATHFYLGNVYQKQGKFDRAVGEYKSAIEKDPEVPIVYNNLAWVFYQTGDYERAIRAFEETIGLQPDLPFPHNGLGCVYQELGSFAEAVEEFKKAIELYPEYAAAHLKLGWCYLQVGELEPAIPEFKAVLEISEDPEYLASSNYSLGHCYLALGQLLEAREAFQKVVSEEDDELLDALLHLGLIQLRLGFADEALTLFRRYLRKSGDEPGGELQKYMAQASFQLERYGAAQRHCREALKEDPDDAEIYELLGQVAGFEGRWKLAIKHLEHAVELAPNSATAFHHLGWVYENLGNVTLAEEAFKAAIGRNPESSEAFSSLAWLYLDQARRDEALVLFEKAVELSPGDIGLINNLGWLYSDLGKFEDALVYYNKGLLVEPNSPLLRTNVGTLYFHMGRVEDAERELKHALFLERDAQATANAHYYMALIARSRDQVTQAIEHLEQALETDPHMAAAYFRLGEMWLQRGVKTKSRQAFERYLDMEPSGEFAGQARQIIADRLARVAAPRGTSRSRQDVISEGSRKPRKPPVPKPRTRSGSTVRGRR